MKHPSEVLAKYYKAHNILHLQTIEYMEYVLHSILDELAKLAIYTFLFAFLDKLSQYLFIIIVLFPVRWSSGGLHSKTFWGCFFYSLLMFIGLIYVAPILPYPHTVSFALLGILALFSCSHVPYTPAFRPITNGRTICKLRCFYIAAIFLWIALLNWPAFPDAYVSSGFYTILFQVVQLFIPKKGVQNDHKTFS